MSSLKSVLQLIKQWKHLTIRQRSLLVKMKEEGGVRWSDISETCLLETAQPRLLLHVEIMKCSLCDPPSACFVIPEVNKIQVGYRLLCTQSVTLQLLHTLRALLVCATIVVCVSFCETEHWVDSGHNQTLISSLGQKSLLAIRWISSDVLSCCLKQFKYTIYAVAKKITNYVKCLTCFGALSICIKRIFPKPFDTFVLYINSFAVSK